MNTLLTLIIEVERDLPVVHMVPHLFHEVSDITRNFDNIRNILLDHGIGGGHGSISLLGTTGTVECT